MNLIQQLLLLDEGMRTHPYKCTAGKLTIGIGRNIEDNGISLEEALYMLDNDIANTIADLEHVLGSHIKPVDVENPRHIALISMMFNLGRGRFCGFVNMIKAIKNEDWEEAANQAVSSQWYRQVGTRAERIEHMLRTGTMPTILLE